MLRSPLPLLLTAITLTGCAISPTALPTPQPGLALHGNVHGGQQPIIGAHVYLFAANTTGYGGSGIAPSTANASLSLLTSASNTTPDTAGNYFVTTDATGSFSITSDYTCTAGQQVYLYALGGNPGAGPNSASALLAILGNCPGPSFSSTTYVWMNEVSTIAAAYAFAGFASDATHVSSSGTPLAQTGIANAFANATNLATLSTGAALATTPVGNGYVPQTTINTLANILASCINSTGAVTGPTNPSPCYTLFTNTPSLTTTPVTPTDTATAAINIAHNPTANVAALYSIQLPTIPFAPIYPGQPLDFTIWIGFTAGLNSAQGVAVDASGNAWVANYGANNVVELSSTGSILSGPSGYTGGGLNEPQDIAIDGSGNVWVPNYGNNSVTKLNSAGGPISSPGGYTGGGLSQPTHVAIDASGSAWVTNLATVNSTYYGSITKLSSSGTPFNPNAIGGLYGQYGGIAVDGSANAWAASYVGSGVTVHKISASETTLASYSSYSLENDPTASPIAMDGNGNAWLATGSASSLSAVTEISNSGTILSGIGFGFTGGGLHAPSRIAIDGAGSAWVANIYNNITGISSSGAFLTGTNGLELPSAIDTGLAVDGSGNLWISNSNFTNRVYEVIGAAVPVITPIAAGLPLIPTTDGSSKLGTRP